MKIIDARSGKQVQPGETVLYDSAVWTVGPGGELHQGPPRGKEGFTLHSLKRTQGKTIADMTIYSPDIPKGEWRKQVPLIVRWMHPGFLFQKVAFIPS